MLKIFSSKKSTSELRHEFQFILEKISKIAAVKTAEGDTDSVKAILDNFENILI